MALSSKLGATTACSSHTLMHCLSILLATLFLPTGAAALDPDLNVSQYSHAAWLAQEGYFSGTPWVVAQTTEGYIWVGTASGLLRFDGSQFLRWTFPEGERLPSNEIISMLGARDGSLWIGTQGGMAHLVNQKLVTLAGIHDKVESILEDPAGNIWFSRQADGNLQEGPICRISGTTLHCLNRSDGIAPIRCCPGALALDHSGDLWLGTDQSLIHWRPGFSKTYPANAAEMEGLDGVDAVLEAPNGSLWVGMSWAGKGGGLEQFNENRTFEPVVSGSFDGSTLKVNRLLLDRDGGLWVGTQDQGLYHIHGTHIDRFGTDEGLSANQVLSIFEDHEGGIWVTTSRGIDSFHQLAVTSYSTHDGLSVDNVVSVLVSRDDTVWLANGKSLDSIKDSRISSIQSGRGLPGHEVTSLFEDHANRLWVGVDNDLYVYEHDHFQKILRQDGSGTRFIVGITEDTTHNVWAEVSGANRELIRIQNLKVDGDYPESVLPSARVLAADGSGGVWLGLRNGDLARFQNGHADVFRIPHDTDSTIRQIVVNSDHSVFATAAFGLIVWRNGNIQTLTSRNGLPCDGIIGVTRDNRGAFWLYTECGLVRIENTDLQRWLADPHTLVAPKVFGVFDGVQPGIPDFNPIAKSSDGRLWFANQFILQSINTNHLAQNALPPPVHVESIIADRKKYSPVEGLRLPPLLRDLEIDYTALSFVNPRAVRFRYRLEGRDSTWQEAGNRRQTFYTHLRPGKYRFRVIACNNDGLWNEEGASVGFSVEPAWYQTTWFIMLAVAGGVGLTFLLFSFGKQRYAKVLRIQYDARLEERTRIARDLHDTLLQTIQGSKLVADHARASVSDPIETQSLLNQLADWLGRATQEGRTALESLHATEAEDLTVALRSIVEDCRANCDADISLSISDSGRGIIPLVKAEVYRIAYEAVRNACKHSGARHLTINLVNRKNLELRIRDDGNGIPEDILREGKVGHFGLRGMRERASKIGAALTISSSLQAGTEVSLVVPGGQLFVAPKTSGLSIPSKWVRSVRSWNRR